MKDFIFGFFTCYVLMMIHSDLMGKEKYIAWIDKEWINTTPTFWLIVWCIGLFLYFVLEIKLS